jgi:hypothetical protein
MSNQNNSDSREPNSGNFEDDDLLPDNAALLSIDEKKALVPQRYEVGRIRSQLAETLDLSRKYIGVYVQSTSRDDESSRLQIRKANH